MEGLKINDVSEKSEAVRDIIGTTPTWIVNWGNTILLLLLLVVLTGLSLIPYPETVRGDVELISLPEAVTITTNGVGRIDSIVADDGSTVASGDTLFVLRSGLTLSQAENLSNIITTVKRDLVERSGNGLLSSPPAGQDAGTAVNLLEDLRANIQSYNVHRSRTDVDRRVKAIKAQIQGYENLSQEAIASISDSENALESIASQYRINETLYQDSLISELTLLEKRNAYEQARVNHRNTVERPLSNDIAIANLSRQMIETRSNYEIELINYELAVRRSITDLEAALNTWVESNIITAPIAGRFTLLDFFVSDEYLPSGSVIANILPQKFEVVGLADISANQSGKVKAGQSAKIELLNFPAMEYGTLKGSVAEILIFPKSNASRLKLTIHPDLVTSYGESIAYRADLVGSMEVIVGDYTFLERIFFEINNLINNR